MLTKAGIAMIKSLSKKSVRDVLSLFVVEGVKMAEEIIAFGGLIKECYVTSHLDREIEDMISAHCEVCRISDADMKRISSLKTASSILLVVKKPACEIDYKAIRQSSILMLDGVQDPGNLGTIIRLADWFGIKDIICSQTTVDLFNSKVVQSTMGAILRVRVHYMNLDEAIMNCKQQGMKVYGTFLEGRNVYEKTLDDGAVIVLGSEGNGISEYIRTLVDEEVTIPRFQDGGGESLNVAVAAAILCSELKCR